ncbi:Tetratricopeptide TPR-1 [Corchorus olitorius]|uniref:Formin-like protein n=1 Tax=Corchorus olitorius TaxID=93759 RepID=A0A1R3ITD4_9ROSI|nr:Tetratricopeptide TPR-1 [Corchorus olitorius]
MNFKESCRSELRTAIRQLSDRCLYSASKWAAEQLVGLEQDSAKFTPSNTRFQRGSSSIRRRFRTNEITSTPPTGVAYVSTPVMEEDEVIHGDFYLLAKSYFDCREYRRAAHVLRDQTGKKSVFLRCYALYLAGEKRKEEEMIELEGPLAAIDAYRRAVDINPRDYRAWYGLGQAYEMMGMPHYALHYFRKSVFFQPIDSRLWIAMGQCYESEQLHMLEEAIKCYKRAANSNDAEAIAMHRLAKLHIELGQPEEAAFYYRKDLERMEAEEREGPNMVEALMFLAQHYKAQKRFEEAEVYCTRLLDYTGPKVCQMLLPQSYGYEENEEDASKVVKRSTKSKSQEEEKAMISMNETPPFPAPSISMKKLKLRPLHWDKVIANSDHSMVWDQIKDGSLRIDDELIETLFANRKSPDINNLPSASAAQIFILEPRKSQNAAIVLKSLAISREEIIDALGQGQGLCADTLEKLTKIAPTPEEEAKILQFSGSPMRLAAAESFLHHVLKAVPSAFIRIRAMLFRYNYDSEILNLKESLQTLDLACKELRSGGLFLKLLEAILKAGNRMNAGTARGNALGFNLTALQKLSHVKSIDGNTTLLHFVVEQVARSQGRSHSLRKNGHVNSDTQEDKDEEYMMLGLPALGALSSELRNVKTAAAMEYENFISMPSNITSRVAEIRQLVTCCDNNDKTGFAMEMRGFLDECEQELRVLKEEQIRVIQLVKRTTEYYQAGAGAEANPLQLFVIVKDFLDMVDRVCADITTKLRRINVIHRHSAGSSPPPSPPRRNPLGLINFRSQFISDMSRTTSSSEDDF